LSVSRPLDVRRRGLFDLGCDLASGGNAFCPSLPGNKYRIVVWINYPYRVVYIRFVGTHRQYDVIDAQTI
jgi:mRNA-degrading endonuclease HigB of HigAB toxin-antitoxin module